MQNQELINHCHKLKEHQTLGEFYKHLERFMNDLGFFQHCYIAIPIALDCRKITPENYLNINSNYSDQIFGYYADEGFETVDPCAQYLLQKHHTHKSLIWYLEDNNPKFTLIDDDYKKLEDDQFMKAIKSKNQLDKFAAQRLKLDKSCPKKFKGCIDVFERNEVQTGVTMPLYNHLFTKGILAGNFKGKGRDFNKFYNKEKHKTLSIFAHLFHQEVQDKFSDKFIAHLLPKLTNKEYSIISYLTHGYTNDQIGHKLNISFSTVRTHINNILRKLSARNVTHACVIAIQSKIIR